MARHHFLKIHRSVFLFRYCTTKKRKKWKKSTQQIYSYDDFVQYFLEILNFINKMKMFKSHQNDDEVTRYLEIT